MINKISNIDLPDSYIRSIVVCTDIDSEFNPLPTIEIIYKNNKLRELIIAEDIENFLNSKIFYNNSWHKYISDYAIDKICELCSDFLYRDEETNKIAYIGPEIPESMAFPDNYIRYHVLECDKIHMIDFSISEGFLEESERFDFLKVLEICYDVSMEFDNIYALGDINEGLTNEFSAS